MLDETLKYKIGITLIKGIGPYLAKNLIAHLGSVEAVFLEKKQNLLKIPGIGETLAGEVATQNVLRRAEKEIDFISKNNIQALFYTDKNYPFRLKECLDSPIMLYSKSSIGLNNDKFIGVVGTRKATDYGRELCTTIIQELVQKTGNIVIVSGLAYGIDIWAHKTSIEYGSSTIGVLGHGLDRIYPAVHRSVAVKMIQNGGLVTEYLSETNPDKQNFVQRNRIIAGLCDAVLVVESGRKGGALITAQIANDYNRDVFAVPGRINDEFSAGCNMLIKQNRASLIDSADDILRFMNWEVKNEKQQEAQTTLFEDLSDNEQELLSALRVKNNGVHVNELVSALKKPYSHISSMLLQMEFRGLVRCLPGGMYRAVR